MINTVKRTGKRFLSAAIALGLLAGLPAGTGENVRAATTLRNPQKNGVSTVYDCVWLGRYPQSDATWQMKEPIKWRVLFVTGDDAFLIADQNLNVQRYNDTGTSMAWKTCTMRSWLNGYGAADNVCGKDYSGDSFIGRAFTAAKQEAIRVTAVENKDNPEYDTAGGNDTQDKIFLLSLEKIANSSYGFSSDYDAYDKARVRTCTAYTAGGGSINGHMYSLGAADDWWLWSPGLYRYDAVYVMKGGGVYRRGGGVGDSGTSVPVH